MKRSLIAGITAGAVILGVIGGGAAAWAAFNAQDEFTGTASAASVGIAQDGSDAEARLAVQYNESTDLYSAAGAVVVTNTGTREASYSIDIEVVDASVAGIKDAIHVGVRAVPAIEDCTPTAQPAQSLSSGSLTFASPSIPGGDPTLAAGSDVILCVESWIDEIAIANLGSTSLHLGIVTRLIYSEASDAWTVWAAEPIEVQQTVVTKDLWLLFAYPVGRYWIDHAWVDEGGELHSYGRVCKDGAYDRPSRHNNTTNCGDEWESQWRLIPVPGTNSSEWWILNAINSYDQPTARAWTFFDMDSPIVNMPYSETGNLDPGLGVDPEHQKWRLEGRGDGTYRIVAAHATDGSGHAVCLTIGGQGNHGNSQLIVPATCDDGSTMQGFTIQLNGYPLPQTRLDGDGDMIYPDGYPLQCEGTQPSNRKFSWLESDQYEGEVHYRLRFDGTVATEHGNGYATSINAGQDLPWIQDWWAANVAGNPVAVQVEAQVLQSITEFGQWIPVTEPRPIWILHLKDTNGDFKNFIYCEQPAIVPASDVLMCTGTYTNQKFEFSTLTAAPLKDYDEFRLVFNGVPLGQTWTQSPAQFGSNASWLNDWWSANAGGAFQTELSVTVEQRLGKAPGEWVPITQPITAWLQHYGNADNRVYCADPPLPVPAGASLTFGGASQSGGVYTATYSWQITATPNGAYNGLAKYRMSIDGVPMHNWTNGLITNAYSIQLGWPPSEHQSTLESILAGADSRVVTVLVEQSINDGPWMPYASRDVEVFKAANAQSWEVLYRVRWTN